MESEGIPDQIQISAETWEMLSNRYQTSSRGEIEIKGHSPRATYMLNQAERRKRVDSADSFLHAVSNREQNNAEFKRKNQESLTNAQYVDALKNQEVSTKNANVQAAVAAENANIQRRNQNESIYSQNMAKAKALKHTRDQKRTQQGLDTIARLGSNSFARSKRDTDLIEYSNLSSKYNTYNREYLPRVKQALVDKKGQGEIDLINAEFYDVHKTTPQELESNLTRMQYEFNPTS